jgi:hypothetical protein
MVTSLTSSFSKKNTQELIKLLTDKFSEKTIWLTSTKITDIKSDIPAHITLLANPQEYLKKLEELKS